VSSKNGGQIKTGEGGGVDLKGFGQRWVKKSIFSSVGNQACQLKKKGKANRILRGVQSRKGLWKKLKGGWLGK